MPTPPAPPAAGPISVAFPQRCTLASPFLGTVPQRSTAPLAPATPPADASPPPAVVAAAVPHAAAAAPLYDLAQQLRLLMHAEEAPAAAPGAAAPAAAAHARSAQCAAYLAGWGRLAEQQGIAVAHPFVGHWG